MNIVKEIKNYVKERCEEYRKNSSDNYDFWTEHIKYVYEESIVLAKIYNANIEIVSLGALLHYIALIEKIGDRKNHHINGERRAKEILENYNYDKEKLDRVLKCVYNHRSSKNATNIEERCVADGDILAHFDNIPMIFNTALVRNKVPLSEVREWMKESFEKDYNDLSEDTKKVFKERYDIIKLIVLGDQYV